MAASISWCPACAKFVKTVQNAIGGHGATVVVLGRIIAPCPYCGTLTSSPGGQFQLDHDVLIRVSDNLDRSQAEELKLRLADYRRQGYTIVELREIVESYAPQLRDYVNSLEQLDEVTKRRWVAILFAILLLIASKTSVSVDIKIDVNRLIDQVIEQINQALE